jgi:nitroimidazol reductase NimA-like FMN-containing flavoprotein (pyridoxamine 5'-phosphate oxidase superfamily)
MVMADVDERTWLEHLPTEECWRLLAGTPVGRIGVLVDSAPEIYPVNHLVDGESIVFRTAAGTKLRGLDRSPSVCYQVDGIDAEAHTGWSVLVKGRAVPLRNTEALRQVADLPLEYWSVGAKPDWVRIVAHEVTGRRIWHGTGTKPQPEPDT